VGKLRGSVRTVACWELGVGGPERFDFLASLSQWRRDGRLERIREDSSMLRSCELGRDESIVPMLSMVIGWDSWERAIGNTMVGICEPERYACDLRSLMLSLGIGQGSWERVLDTTVQGDYELVRDRFYGLALSVAWRLLE
jgi:hypothetical protein